MLKPQNVSWNSDINKIIPKWNNIPEEFKNMNNTNKWTDIVSKWFFQGLPRDTKFIPKHDIDAKQALVHVSHILQSFEPKHEHKTAACAYLLYLWFDDIIIH